MYKLNLQNLNESDWIGSKVCLKKNLPQPQSLRNLKFKKYPFWRIDKKDLQIINGGWHFSFLQSPEDIAKKIKSFSHGEYKTEDNININQINKKIKDNIDIFNRGHKLRKIDIDETYPNYILDNKSLLKDWII